MWKEKLPKNCPPTRAEKRTVKMFRVIAEKKLTPSDFNCYASGDWERYKHSCDAHAVSFFNTLKNMVATYKRSLKSDNNLGNFIAEVQVSEEHGVSTFKENTGHYNVWLFDSSQLEQFQILSLYDVDGNPV